VCCAVYRSDPHQAPDSDFEPGALGRLVAGNSGRLLDARRTPVLVTGVDLRDGMFEVEIQAFEDAGARWRIPLEDVGRYQFAPGEDRASEQEVSEMERVSARLDRPLLVGVDDAAAAAGARLLEGERARAARWLGGRIPGDLDLPRGIATREGDPRLMELLQEYMRGRGVLEMEQALSRALVSNPAAGELVKGHGIVLAELGLCPFEGKVVRGADVLSGAWSRERRTEHLLARLGFSGALWSALGGGVSVYRAVSSETALSRTADGSFVSATLSREVALSHLAGGPTTRVAAIRRSPLDPARVLMSFLETEAMNRQYREAEVVLTGSAPGARA
jgi:hypothetical protein